VRVSEAIPLSRMSLDAEDLVLAAQQGYEFRLSSDHQTAELWKSSVSAQVSVMRFAKSRDNLEQISEICRVLELDQTLDSYRIRIDSAGQLKVPNSRRNVMGSRQRGMPISLRDEINMSTRSLKEMMFYLSHSVNVPSEHYECGYVRSTFDGSSVPFDWNVMTEGLFHVHCSEHEPSEAAVAVEHRGYWFYVLDCDLDTKSTFNLLLELINLEIRAGGGAQIPLLTI
jgi:hypothetical protein